MPAAAHTQWRTVASTMTHTEISSAPCSRSSANVSRRGLPPAYTRPPAQLTLDDKVKRLDALAADNAAIPLDTKSFLSFVEHPRNYSLVVVFTTTDAAQACDLCQYVLGRAFARARAWERTQRANQASEHCGEVGGGGRGGRTFAPEYNIVAKSWRAQNKPGRLYTGVLEYGKGQEIFRKVGVVTRARLAVALGLTALTVLWPRARVRAILHSSS